MKKAYLYIQKKDRLGKVGTFAVDEDGVRNALKYIIKNIIKIT